MHRANGVKNCSYTLYTYSNQKQMLKLSKEKRKTLYFFMVLLIIFVVLFRRNIYIRFLFFVYDCIALFGLRKDWSPEYCSEEINGFTPVMPLEYYADFNKAIYPRVYSGNNEINKQKIIEICDRNLQWLEKNGEPVSAAEQIPILDYDDSETQSKVLSYIEKKVPFVIRNFHMNVHDNLKLDKLMEISKDDKVYMSPSGEKCKEHVFAPLKELRERGCYVTNSTNLFHKYPDLFSKEDLSKLESYVNHILHCDSQQLFIGLQKGQGTQLHAAYTNNFFFMIQGEKKWSFFNPNQLALLYPNFVKSGIYMASESRFLNGDEFDYKRFPLLKYAHRYETILKEGDLLYNPKSWFHAVYNMTEPSVACSTRWSKGFFHDIPDTRMLRYGNLTNTHLRDYVTELYVNTGHLGIEQIDEHKHLIGTHDPNTIPLWDKETNASQKICKKEDACEKHWHT
jgi:hypothetical protein